MNIVKQLSKTLKNILSSLGYGNSTISRFHKLKTHYVTRKGNRIKSPTEEQVYKYLSHILSKSKISQWHIIDNTDIYEHDAWPIRELREIDTIVISSSNNEKWDAYDYTRHQMSKEWPKGELPGVGCHVYINYSGIIEKLASYDKVINHTTNFNQNSVCITLQYRIDNNDSPPVRKVYEALIKVLCILCLELKLDPQRAIKGQSECGMSLDLHEKKSPGMLLLMDQVRMDVITMLQKKLRFMGLYDGQVTGKTNTKLRIAINGYNAEALKLLYKNFKIKEE